ncbi:MAG: hypothetical protein DRN14_04185 [Thermoplasmata archaeon]|nr:MAG: hypothetical protein DRN14_04185 [Thermoplasmata archaeon]
MYEEVYRNTLTDQKHTEFVCPLCKTKTVYETPYKQLVCSKCLLVIKQGHRVPKEIKEQVVKLHREEGYQYTELIRKFCLSPSMVHSILVRQRD